MTALHLLKTSLLSAWAYHLMRQLVVLGVRVHAAMPPGGPLVDLCRSAGIVVHEVDVSLPVRAPWRFVKTRSTIDALIEDVRPDVLHSHFVTTTLAMRLALGRHHPVPRVFQVPGPLHLEHGLYRAADVAAAGPADWWVGTCTWTCEQYLRQGVRPDRVRLSYYGLDLSAFVRRRPGKLRSELRVASNTKLVGMVAWIYRPKYYLGHTRGIKGHEDLIDAVAIALRDDPDILGVIVGGAWTGAARYEQRVRRYAQRRCGNRIVFLGPRHDVADLYADFDVAVHPSHSENVGGAVESLLLEVPTISTNVGGFPDVVRHGVTGWLVPPGDPPALAHKILDALKRPQHARSLASNGRELARSLFDLIATSQEILNLYQEMTEHAPPAQ